MPKKRIIESAGAVLLAIILLLIGGVKIPGFDRNADSYFSEAITKAGLAYATCRTINATVSTIQNSEIQVEPGGVGLSLAAGQALDPINDLTERLSDVIVTAISSLGVQKLAYEISVLVAPPVLAIALILFSFIIWVKNHKLKNFSQFLIRFIFFVLIARFCLPISSLTNKFIHKHFFAQQIEQSKKELALGTADLDKLMKFTTPESVGILGTIKNSGAFLKQKSVEFKNALVSIVDNAGKIIENLLKLTYLYIGIFLIQVIMLPLLIFWLLMKFTNTLFSTESSVVIDGLRGEGGTQEAEVTPEIGQELKE